MRGNNRKSIEKCRKKLPQFTTMNVIDGQAGLVIYSSLIFYSLTIDNILNIIILLILAGVSIAMLTGENGILTKATESKKANIVGKEKEQIRLAMQSLKMKKHVDNVSTIVLPEELQEQLIYDGEKNVIVEAGENNKLVVNYEESKNSYIVDQDGNLQENSNDKEEIYSEEIDESQIAPTELFDFEIIQGTASNTKIATIGNISGLPQKEAKITRIKPEYVNENGYNPYTGKNDLEDTNYEIKYKGITDTLIIPYQVEIEGEMYKITEVNLSIYSNFVSNASLPSIENIIYPNTVKNMLYDGYSGLNYEGNNINRVKKVVLSKNLKEIPKGFFCRGSNIEQIEIPSTVTRIGNAAFAGCSSLTKINIPANVTMIGNTAFAGCSSLTKINIPSNVKTIGSYVFMSCNLLTEINIAQPANSIKGAPWGAGPITKIIWDYQGK